MLLQPLQSPAMADVRRTGDVVDIVCESAIEFVSVLDPMTGPFLQPPQIPIYLFRGVSSITHPLIPAAYRPDKYLIDGVDGMWKHPPMDSVRHQIAAELATLRAFFETCASHGIRLPEDSQLLRQSLDRWQQLLLGVTNNPNLQPASVFSPGRPNTHDRVHIFRLATGHSSR